MTVRDVGLSEERTQLARRRTTLPFLVLALLGVRAAVDSPLPGVLVAVLAGVGALICVRQQGGRLLTPVVLLLALAALAVPPP